MNETRVTVAERKSEALKRTHSRPVFSARRTNRLIPNTYTRGIPTNTHTHTSYVRPSVCLFTAHSDSRPLILSHPIERRLLSRTDDDDDDGLAVSFMYCLRTAAAASLLIPVHTVREYSHRSAAAGPCQVQCHHPSGGR